MPTTAYTSVAAPFRGGHKVTWSNIPNGNQGAGWSSGPFTVLTMQVLGTFGAGGTVMLEGSLDGTNWGRMHDPAGNDALVSIATCVRIMECPLWIRPNVNAGDGTTSLTVILLAIGGQA